MDRQDAGGAGSICGRLAHTHANVDRCSRDCVPGGRRQRCYLRADGTEGWGGGQGGDGHLDEGVLVSTDTHTDTFSHSTEGGRAGGHMTSTVTVAEMNGSVVPGADRRPADLQISPGDLQGRQTPSKQSQFDES